MNTSNVEAPSGKNAASENFPVGSWLIAKHLRPHVAAFYAFARCIDDIADSAELNPEDKLNRLAGFSEALNGNPVENDADYIKALDLKDSLIETGINVAHAQDLITAFRQDCVKNRYDSWQDLVAYCELSAAPVGRYLIDLHAINRERSIYKASDKLCIALQVINHLQDLKDDYESLDRVYLPADWIVQEAVCVENLGDERVTAGMRAVIDRTLDATEMLLLEAQRVHLEIVDRRLAMEASVIWQIAKALCSKLRRFDPLERRVTLSKISLVWCFIRGIVACLGNRREGRL